MHSGHQGKVMGRYMGRNRWVALEQTMSSPEGILFIFHFSHPPIFLVPPNSHHHPRTRSRGWWCCYALGWLLRFESIAFPSDASNYARFRNLTTHSPFHRLFLITLFRRTFEIQCGGVSASYLPEFLGACPHRRVLLPKFRIVQNFLFWKFGCPPHPSKSRWWSIADYNSFF